MFDIGWSEMMLILVLAIVLIGPKDIPEVIRGAGRIIRRVQYLRFALSKQFDDFMEKSDLHELRRGSIGMMNTKNIMTPLPDQKQKTTAPEHEADDDEAYYAEHLPENDQQPEHIPVNHDRANS
jgi:Tat protein translocase TatB subunit